jgi:hypothetical protein
MRPMSHCTNNTKLSMHSAVPGCVLGSKSGQAVAQVVSSRLSTAAGRVRDRIRSCGICGGQSDIGEGFLRVFRFPLPIIPPTAPHSPLPIIILG